VQSNYPPYDSIASMVLFGIFSLTDRHKRRARVAQNKQDKQDSCNACSCDSFDPTKWSSCSFDVTAFFRSDEENDYDKVEFMNESNNTLGSDQFFPTPPGTAMSGGMDRPAIHIDFDPDVILRKSSNLLDTRIDNDEDADADFEIGLNAVAGFAKRLDQPNLTSPQSPQLPLPQKSSESSLEEEAPSPMPYQKPQIDINLNQGLKKLADPNPHTEYIVMRYKRARIESSLDHLCPPTDRIFSRRRHTRPTTEKISNTTKSKMSSKIEGEEESSPTFNLDLPYSTIISINQQDEPPSVGRRTRPTTEKISNTTMSKISSKIEGVEELSSKFNLDLPYSTIIPINQQDGPLPVTATQSETNLNAHKVNHHLRNDTTPITLENTSIDEKNSSTNEKQPSLYTSSAITTNEPHGLQAPHSTTNMVESQPDESLGKKACSEPTPIPTTIPNSFVDENHTFLNISEAFSQDESNASDPHPRTTGLNAANRQQCRSFRSLGDDISEGRGNEKRGEFEEQRRNGKLCFFNSEDRIDYVKNPHLYRRENNDKPSYIETRVERDYTINPNNEQEENETGRDSLDLYITGETSDKKNTTSANKFGEDDDNLSYKPSFREKPSNDNDLSYASSMLSKAFASDNAEKEQDYNISYRTAELDEIVEEPRSQVSLNAHREEDEFFLSYESEKITAVISNARADEKACKNETGEPSKNAMPSNELSPVKHPLHQDGKSPVTFNVGVKQQSYNSDFRPGNGHDISSITLNLLPQPSSISTHTLRVGSSFSSSYSTDNPNILVLKNRLQQIRNRIHGRIQDNALFEPSKALLIHDVKKDCCNDIGDKPSKSSIYDAKKSNFIDIGVQPSISSLHDVKKDYSVDIGVQSSMSSIHDTKKSNFIDIGVQPSMSSIQDVKKGHCIDVEEEGEWEGWEESYQNIPNLMDGIRSEDGVTVQDNGQLIKLANKPEKPSSPTGVEDFEPGMESPFYMVSVAGIGEKGGTKLLHDLARSDSMSTMALLSASNLSKLKEGQKSSTSNINDSSTGRHSILRLKSRLRRIEENVKVLKMC